MKQDDINIEIGGKGTFEAFTQALSGAQPGESREADITYPEDYAAERLAGKTVRFLIHLKQIRLKELPELNEEFAKDLGDFQNLDELRAELRKSIFQERESAAQSEAKNAIIEKLVDAHDFPVPEVYVDQQVQGIVEGQPDRWPLRAWMSESSSSIGTNCGRRRQHAPGGTSWPA